MPKRNVYRWIPLYNNEKERERVFECVAGGGGGGGGGGTKSLICMVSAAQWREGVSTFAPTYDFVAPFP